MKLHYYPDTDSLYIELVSGPNSDSRDISDGLVADYDQTGRLVCLNIQNASQHIVLSRIETKQPPFPISPASCNFLSLGCALKKTHKQLGGADRFHNARREAWDNIGEDGASDVLDSQSKLSS